MVVKFGATTAETGAGFLEDEPPPHAESTSSSITNASAWQPLANARDHASAKLTMAAVTETSEVFKAHSSRTPAIHMTGLVDSADGAA
jgi:hypothetical protein